MTYEQNVKAILESNFAGFKEEIIDIACKRICMLETKEETIDYVLEIIDKADEEHELWALKFQKVLDAVLALKGEQE